MPWAAGDRRLRASSRALGASMMCSSGPETIRPRTAGAAGGDPRHLVQHGEAAVDLVAGSAVVFDGAGQVLAETAVQKVIVIADVETGFGEEVGEIPFEILSDAQQVGVQGLRFADDLRLFIVVGETPPRVLTTISGRHGRYHTPQRARNVVPLPVRCNSCVETLRRTLF